MDFLELLKSDNIKEAYTLMKPKEGIDKYSNEFNNKRDIRDTQVGKRKDKQTKEDTVVVAKIPIPFQRKIVRTAATFLLGSPVKLVQKQDTDQQKDSDNKAFKALIDLWDEIRMDAILLNFCKAVKAETEAAIIFFDKKTETDGKNKVKIKANLKTHKNGKLLPVFDAFGDMVAFGWEYKAKEGDKEVDYLYIWTNETKYLFKKGDADWQPAPENPKTPNLFKKIPVVYMSQDNPEWWEVQELIDRFEMNFSKFADTNDYFASPMYKAKGAITSVPKKDETGKMVKLDIVETSKGNIIEADLEVISWDRAPEALKLEFETAKGLIYGLTDTPDLTFDNVKGIGNVTGIALKLMFLGPILKALESQGDYQTAISRIINVLKAGIGGITETGLKNSLAELKLDVTFTSVLPENLKETIELLSEATGGKPVMSQKTAVSHNPLIDNNEEELATLQEEQKAANTLDLGQSFN